MPEALVGNFHCCWLANTGPLEPQADGDISGRLLQRWGCIHMARSPQYAAQVGCRTEPLAFCKVTDAIQRHDWTRFSLNINNMDHNVKPHKLMNDVLPVCAHLCSSRRYRYLSMSPSFEPTSSMLDATLIFLDIVAPDQRRISRETRSMLLKRHFYQWMPRHSPDEFKAVSL